MICKLSIVRSFSWFLLFVFQKAKVIFNWQLTACRSDFVLICFSLSLIYEFLSLIWWLVSLFYFREVWFWECFLGLECSCLFFWVRCMLKKWFFHCFEKIICYICVFKFWMYEEIFILFCALFCDMFRQILCEWKRREVWCRWIDNGAYQRCVWVAYSNVERNSCVDSVACDFDKWWQIRCFYVFKV